MKGTPEDPEWDLTPEQRERFEKIKAAMLTTYPQYRVLFADPRFPEVVYAFGYMDGQIAAFREDGR